MLFLSSYGGIFISEKYRRAELKRVIDKINKEVELIPAPQLKKPCNILFYGYGKAAEAAAWAILRAEQLSGKVGSIGFVGTKSHHWEMELFEKQANDSYPNVKINVINHDSIANYNEREIDILFLTARVAPKNSRNRFEMYKPNEPLLREIADLSERVKINHVRVFTNPAELLSYGLLKILGCETYVISYLSHIDKIRLDSVLIGEFGRREVHIERTDAFCVGTHQKPWAVLNGMLVDRGYGFESLDSVISEKGQVQISKRVEGRGHFLKDIAEKIDAELKGISPSDKECADVFVNEVAGLIFEDRILNNGVFWDDFYVEGPTTNLDGLARPNKTLIDRLTEEDRRQLGRRKDKLAEDLEAVGLITRPFISLGRTRYEITEDVGRPLSILSRNDKNRPKNVFEEYNDSVKGQGIVVFAAGGYDLMRMQSDRNGRKSFRKIGLDFKTRSAEVINIFGERYLALGRTDGVEIRELDKWDKLGIVYAAEGIGVHKSYFYSAGSFDNWIYASNSKAGLFLWDLKMTAQQSKFLHGKEKDEVRFSKVIESGGRRFIVYLEGRHQILATPLDNLEEKAIVYSTLNGSDILSRDSAVTSVLYRNGNIYVGLLGGKVYEVDPNKGFNTRPIADISRQAGIWSMDIADIFGEDYFVVADPDKGVLFFDVRQQEDPRFLNHAGSKKPFYSIRARGTRVFGTNRNNLFCWNLARPDLVETEDEWSGNYCMVDIE